MGGSTIYKLLVGTNADYHKVVEWAWKSDLARATVLVNKVPLGNLEISYLRKKWCTRRNTL